MQRDVRNKFAVKLLPETGMYGKHFKRPMDFILSLCALIILAPILLITALLVRVKIGSPIFFKQKRPGLNEKIFIMYKFRTMTDARDENGELLPDSIRLTKFGRFLRSTSLDELPELWNILKGDMSIIGPRPLLIQYLPYYTEQEKVRHSVRPGLSGLAQISGRNNLEWNTRLMQDVAYVHRISFLLDLKIIFQTLIKAFKREGVAVIDEAALKDLDCERRKVFTIKELNSEDIKTYYQSIMELLIDNYILNFQISRHQASNICKEKLELLEGYLHNENAVVIGAVEGSELIAFVWLYKHNFFGENRLHINHIVVSSQARGKGIGKQLIQEAEKLAIRSDIKTIDLFVSEINEAALNLYDRLGFETERRYMKKKL